MPVLSTRALLIGRYFARWMAGSRCWSSFRTARDPMVLASAAETDRLQAHGATNVLGFNWGIDPASPEVIHDAQFGMKHPPPRLDHDALADSVIDRQDDLSRVRERRMDGDRYAGLGSRAAPGIPSGSEAVSSSRLITTRGARKNMKTLAIGGEARARTPAQQPAGRPALHRRRYYQGRFAVHCLLSTVVGATHAGSRPRRRRSHARGPRAQRRAFHHSPRRPRRNCIDAGLWTGFRPSTSATSTT